MIETIKPPQERTHADYGVGSYLLAVTRTITDNPPADSPDLLPGSETSSKRISPYEHLNMSMYLSQEFAQDD